MGLNNQEIEKVMADSYELSNNVLKAVPNPLVSVRIITYQQVDYIRDCIEGALEQKTTFPVEYIIGEDFSTDGTREIVLEYAKKYPDKIRVITADYNVGGLNNGYRCIKKYRGKYIAVCEGDDFWMDPYKLQKQVDFLENNSDYSLCVHASAYLYPNGKLIEEYPEIKSKEIKCEDLIRKCGNYFTTASYAYRRIIMDEMHEWIYQAPVGVDYYVTLVSAMYGKVFYINDVMSAYRVKAKNSCTSKIPNRNIQWLKNYTNQHINHLNEYNLLTNFVFNKTIKNKQKDILTSMIIDILRKNILQGLKLMLYYFDRVIFKIFIRFIKYAYKNNSYFTCSRIWKSLQC